VDSEWVFPKAVSVLTDHHETIDFSSLAGRDRRSVPMKKTDMDNRRLKVLLVEDDEDDFVMTRDLLSEIDESRFDLEWVATYDAALETMIGNRHDVYLVDYRMGGHNGITLLREAVDCGCRAPIILMTGQGDREVDMEAMEAGAADYLDKGEVGPRLLERSIRYAVERYRMRAERRAAESRFESIIESNIDGILIVDRNGVVKFVNPAAGKIFRRKAGAFVGGRFEFSLESDETREIEIFHGNEEILTLEMRVTEIDWEGENARLASLRNITERKKTENALRSSEIQKRAILDASLDCIRYVDRDMRIIWSNKTNIIGLGLTPQDLIGRTCYEVFVGRDKPCEGCPTLKARDTGKTERAIIKIPDRQNYEGDTFWYDYCVPITNDAGEVTNFIQISRNVTELKQAEERIRTLTQKLIKAHENERQRLFRGLHDSVAQNLSALKIGVETLFDPFPEVPEEIGRRLSECSGILSGLVVEIRNLSYDLCPVCLDELGLGKAVSQFCDEFSARTAIPVNFIHFGIDNVKLDPDMEINLYRLIQEALENVKNHADAGNVTIRLVASFPRVILRIEDNGKGFDVENRLISASKEKRLGLYSMQERVRLLDGKMSIRSKPMRGTKIRIEVPFRPKNDFNGSGAWAGGGLIGA